MGREMGASAGADVTKCGWAWLFMIFSVILFSAGFIVAHKIYFNPFKDNGKPSQGGGRGFRSPWGKLALLPRPL